MCVCIMALTPSCVPLVLIPPLERVWVCCCVCEHVGERERESVCVVVLTPSFVWGGVVCVGGRERVRVCVYNSVNSFVCASSTHSSVSTCVYVEGVVCVCGRQRVRVCV